MMRNSRATWAAVALVVAGAAALAAFVLAHQGRIEYDDAQYVERGFFLAHQVESRGDWPVPRLAWSLMLEAPKPPLYAGGLALAALAFGDEGIPAVLALGVALPFALLAFAAWGIGAETAGPRAGLLALGVLAATPLVLQMGSRLMVETTLAAWVTFGGWAALRRLADRRGPWAEAALGCALGLASFTKLLGPLFLGPLVLITAAAVGRREGARPAARLLLVAGAVAAAIAGPWYLRNGRLAIDFALFAASSWPHQDAGGPWSRPGRLALAAFGLPLMVLLAAAAWRAWSDRGAASRARRDLAGIAAAVALVSAIVLVVPPNFDPRFWTPCLGLVAAWAGVELERQAMRWKRGLAPVAAVVLVLGCVASHRLATSTQASTPWALRHHLAGAVQGLAPPVRLCTLGESPSWNRYKLRLLAELSPVRPRPLVVDLLHEVTPDRFEAELASCGLIFVLDPREIPDERSQIRQNAGIETLRERLHGAREQFDVIALPAEAWGVPTRVEVLRRRATGAADR